MDLFDESYDRHKQAIDKQQARWDAWLAKHPVILIAVAIVTLIIILSAMYLSS